MSDPVDQEIEAIKRVLQALTPLSPKARASVLNYVVKRLDMIISSPQEQSPAPGAPGDGKQETEQQRAPEVPTHIKDLKEQKKPRSANEMAALVAYYLANVVPIADRKQTVTQNDIVTTSRLPHSDFRNTSRDVAKRKGGWLLRSGG